MHKQAGYQFALKNPPQYVEDEATGFIAILHGQIVAERTGKRLRLNDTGHQTPSTARAMNGAFSDAGLSGYKVLLNEDGLQLLDSRRGETRISGELTITLD